MRLCTYLDQDAGERLGLVAADRLLAATELLPSAPRTIEELLSAWPAARRALGDAADPNRIEVEGRPIEQVQLLAPVPRPGKVVAIGRNYREHANEEGLAPPTDPLIFAKFPTSVTGHDAVISWDIGLTDAVDYEAELGVVIGRRARRIGVQDALQAVLGYTCLNDVSARDLQFADGQWTRGKSLDTFCPMGPAIVTADEFEGEPDVAIRCLVNGEERQSSRTGLLWFGVADLVSRCSTAFTLMPGDIIATGTPGGTGHFRHPPAYLSDGDEVVVEIERIGRLVNRCRVEVPA